MGEIHELLVLALSLVWSAGVTPDFSGRNERHFSAGKHMPLQENPSFCGKPVCLEFPLKTQKSRMVVCFLDAVSRCDLDSETPVCSYYHSSVLFANLGEFVCNCGWVFAILFELPWMQSQEVIHHFAGCPRNILTIFLAAGLQKIIGVQNSMGNKVPWTTGMLIYLPVTSRPLIFLQKEAIWSPCNFATTHLKACILNFDLPSNFATHETEDPFASPHFGLEH